MPAQNGGRSAPSYPIHRPAFTSSPDPDPEPPAAPPIIILSRGSREPHFSEFQALDPESGPEPHTATSSPNKKDNSSHSPRYNLRSCSQRPVTHPKEPTPDPYPCAPPVIILPHKRPASASPPRSPPAINITPDVAPSISSHTNSISPTLHSAQTLPTPTPAADPSAPTTSAATTTSDFASQPGPSDDKTHYKHTMGSKGSKLAPSHGKLQPSLEKQDKAEMKEPSNYYSHRSKSMRRKAGRSGATDGAGGLGGAAGGGVGGAV